MEIEINAAEGVSRSDAVDRHVHDKLGTLLINESRPRSSRFWPPG
ncbi:MAG: hypothetical protein U5K43_13200 [Halofilum sp. (in: g-proteobacteria)]|nr:hypothetical protein [Halofilum sp. (in: g-proteobacteria)]